MGHGIGQAHRLTRAERLELEARVRVGQTHAAAATEASRRWAALLRQIFEVEPLRCPRCHGPMRIVAVITPMAVIDQILTHLGPCAGARRDDQPPRRRPEAPRVHPGSLLGGVRGARRSGMEPSPAHTDPPQGGADARTPEPRRGPPRCTAGGLVAQRATRR